MVRRPAPVITLLVLAAACTSGEMVPRASPSVPAVGSPNLTPTPAPTPAEDPVVLDVVADLAPSPGGLGSLEVGNTYIEGMQLAVQEVNGRGGVSGRPVELALHDDEGHPELFAGLIGSLLEQDATAILYAGPGPALTPLRPQFAATGTPVILLEGDLYTSRGLFPQVFQTSIPWAWQAHDIARYVVRDRKAEDIVFVGTGPEAPVARRALRGALEYWGGRLAAGFDDRSRDERGLSRAFERAARADWAVAFGPQVDALEVVNAIEEAAEAKPGITGPAALLISHPALADPEPGTSACYTYTWAGWADPIPRVGRFRRRFERFAGRLPQGLEQEGYDAIRALVVALRKTGGRGGDELRKQLEQIKGRLFSGFPVDLGPDDHVFPPRDELGLFAVAGPDERLDPWQAPPTATKGVWRAVMRTFTYDGQRTNVLDRDRRVFFPFWNKRVPAPGYWRSRFGIVTRPRDPLH
ncbi:MAG: ABC transporter substrate-binding protein [Actinomycetota bacterium]